VHVRYADQVSVRAGGSLRFHRGSRQDGWRTGGGSCQQLIAMRVSRHGWRINVQVFGYRARGQLAADRLERSIGHIGGDKVKVLILVSDFSALLLDLFDKVVVWFRRTDQDFLGERLRADKRRQ